MIESLEGKVCIVTGAGSGMGRASALRLARAGVKVVASDLNLETAAATVAMIAADGGTAIPFACDVSNQEQVAATVAAAVETFGSLQLLHNNAAHTALVMSGADGAVVDTPVDVWDATMAVNLRGPFLMCKYAIPAMISAGGGAIVNTSSASSQYGELDKAAYGASKAGLESLTRSVATQYGKQGIRCNAISPGAVKTEAYYEIIKPEQEDLWKRSHLTPDMAEPAQIADVVAFLLSDAASFVTGEKIDVDGGLTKHIPLFGEIQKMLAGSAV
jgi:NAD(P)-dependent dehydrogenase (short-subunit alcohol dehydrogenase family)